MTKRVLGWAPPLVIVLCATGCVQPNKATARSTEDVFGMPRPSYAAGRQIEGHVLRMNTMAQMITIAAGEGGRGAGEGEHGAAELTFPVENQGVAALRTLWPGARVILTCRAVDSASLEARITPTSGPVGGGAQAGQYGMAAACPSVIRIEKQ